MDTFHKLSWVGSGTLFALAFLHSLLWWCYILGFVWMLFLIQKEDSYKKVFVLGWVVGVLHIAGAIAWFWSTYPLAYFGEDKIIAQHIGITAYWLSTALVLGLKTGVFAVCAKKVLSTIYIFLLPFVWVLLEVGGSFLFSIYSWGEGAYLNANFSFGYLGYIIAEYPLFLQCAKWGGVYILSLIAVFICILIFLSIKRAGYKALILSLIILLLGYFFLPANLFYNQSKSSPQYTVLSVETYFDQDFFNLDDLSLRSSAVSNAVAQALTYEPSVIVLPEDSDFTSFFTHPEDIFSWAGTSTVIIIDSASVDSDYYENKKNVRAYVYDLGVGDIYYVDKKYLVPQGEFTPYFHNMILSLFFDGAVLEGMYMQQSFVPSVSADVPKLPAYIPSILFCFESVSPLGVQSQTDIQKSPFIVHPLSHSWFNTPHSLWYQLDNMLQIQSVWSHKPIVSSGNMSESKLYTPDGKVTSGTILKRDRYWALKSFKF